MRHSIRVTGRCRYTMQVQARDVLVRMLGEVHPDWVWTVLAALWKMKPAVLVGARSAVEPFVDDPYFANRREAGKIMRKIERYEARLKQKQQSGS